MDFIKYQPDSVKALFSLETWEIEDSYNKTAAFDIATKYWKICFPVSVLYVLAIIYGTKYMATRPRFNLKFPLFLWSSLLAMFSIVGFIRCITWLAHHPKRYETFYLMCDREYFVAKPIAFWSAMFTMSKFIELTDTAFIVLRKQKLIFLHWYHHFTVLMYCCWSYPNMHRGGLIYCLMNYGVHAIMYSYYAIRAYGLRPPRIIAMCVTLLQIIQMVVGFTTLYFLNKWKEHPDCNSPVIHLVFTGIMYGSYLILFCHFFFVTYLKQPTKISHTPKEVEATPKKNVHENGSKKKHTGRNLRKRLAN